MNEWSLLSEVHLLEAKYLGSLVRRPPPFLALQLCVHNNTQRMKAQILKLLQTWQSDLNLNQKSERKVRNKDEKRKRKQNWLWLREGLEPVTWQIGCHALANWATESLGKSVAEFEYLHVRLSCQLGIQLEQIPSCYVRWLWVTYLVYHGVR